MTRDVKADVRRRRAYNSPLRADQAQQTRRRVLEAARELFIEHGYAGTTVAAVADRAGVSPETIYLALGGKRGLLEGVMNITGPHESAAEDEAWWQAVADLPTADERLERMTEYSCRILARTWPIHAIIRGAADKEAFAKELSQQLLDERLANQTQRVRRYLAGDLRPGLTVPAAGERYCALASPELFHVLTAQLRWPAEDHRAWLIDLLRADLLGRSTEDRSPRARTRRS
jgi:AcrR family transcriptional regulator